MNRSHLAREDANTSVESYLAAKSIRAPLGRGDLPFVVGPALVAQEELPPLQPALKLDDTAL
jgi:hypothetical protein